MPAIHRRKKQKKKKEEKKNFKQNDPQTEKKAAPRKSTSPEQLPGGLSKSAEILSGQLSGVKRAGVDVMKRKIPFHEPAIFIGRRQVSRCDSFSDPSTTSSKHYVQNSTKIDLNRLNWSNLQWIFVSVVTGRRALRSAAPGCETISPTVQYK